MERLTKRQRAVLAMAPAIREAVQAGVPQAEVAARFGVSKWAVSRHGGRSGRRGHRPGTLPPSTTAAILEMLLAGRRHDEIKAALGCSSASISRAWRRATAADPGLVQRRPVNRGGRATGITPELCDRVAALALAGEDNLAIAEAVGMAPSSIRKLLTRLRAQGLALPPRRPLPAAKPDPAPAMGATVARFANSGRRQRVTVPLPDRATQLRLIDEAIAAGRGRRFEYAGGRQASFLEGAEDAADWLRRGGIEVETKQVPGEPRRWRIMDGGDGQRLGWMWPTQFVVRVRELAAATGWREVPIVPPPSPEARP